MVFSGFNFQSNHKRLSTACVLRDVTQCHVVVGGEKTCVKIMWKGGDGCRGVVFWKLGVSSGDPVDFSFRKSCYARHRPTPRKVFTKNVRCAVFAQKQETVNISSIKKKTLLWQLVTAWELPQHHARPNESNGLLLHARISQTCATVPTFHIEETAAPVIIVSTLMENPA